MLKNWLTGENKLCTKWWFSLHSRICTYLPTHLINIFQNINLKHFTTIYVFPLFDLKKEKKIPLLHCDTPAVICNALRKNQQSHCNSRCIVAENSSIMWLSPTFQSFSPTFKRPSILGYKSQDKQASSSSSSRLLFHPHFRAVKQRASSPCQNFGIFRYQFIPDDIS